MYFFCKFYCASLNELDMAEAHEQMNEDPKAVLFNALNNNQAPNIDTNNSKEQNDENQNNNQQKKNLIDKEYLALFYQKLNTLSQEHFSVLNFEEIKKFFNENRDNIQNKIKNPYNYFVAFSFTQHPHNMIKITQNILGKNFLDFLNNVSKNTPNKSLIANSLMHTLYDKSIKIFMQYDNHTFLVEYKDDKILYIGEQIPIELKNSEDLLKENMKKILTDFELLFTLNNDKNLNQIDLSNQQNQSKNKKKHGYQSLIIGCLILISSGCVIVQFIK